MNLSILEIYILYVVARDTIFCYFTIMCEVRFFLSALLVLSFSSRDWSQEFFFKKICWTLARSVSLYLLLLFRLLSLKLLVVFYILFIPVKANWNSFYGVLLTRQCRNRNLFAMNKIVFAIFHGVLDLKHGIWSQYLKLKVRTRFIIKETWWFHENLVCII